MVLLLLFIKEPVVSHDKPGAADHSSVDRDVVFDPTQSSPVQNLVLVTIYF